MKSDGNSSNSSALTWSPPHSATYSLNLFHVGWLFKISNFK